MRVVFDTNTVVSALLFEQGELSWLRLHWRLGRATALVSRATVGELIRVLTYPKFGLEKAEIEALLADYLPYTEAVEVSPQKTNPRCRDADDQMFVDLAIAGKADVLVTGDRALLEMKIGSAVEKAATYRSRYQ